MLKKIFEFSKVNATIWYLTASDIFTWGLYMTLNSFAAIYLSGKLGVEILQIIGIGAGIFYFSKGLFQIPIGILTDKIKGAGDDIFGLGLGNFLMGFPFALYPFLTNEYFYFVLQFIIGLGAALNLVNWRKLFAANLDKGKEGYEYGMYDTTMSFATAIFGIAAGLVANLNELAFDIVMFSVGGLMISSTMWAIAIFKNEAKNGNNKI